MEQRARQSGGSAPSNSQPAKKLKADAANEEELTTSGVPGLDLDTPRASLSKTRAAKKRPRVAVEELLTLEDDPDNLYSFGPSPASLAAASEGRRWFLPKRSCLSVFYASQ